MTKEVFSSDWTLDEALVLVRLLEKELHPKGFHVALGGGVLIEGKSDHDIDLWIYPRRVDFESCHLSYGDLVLALRTIGWQQLRDYETVWEHWKAAYGSTDEKVMEIWVTADGKRVDVHMPYMV